MHAALYERNGPAREVLQVLEVPLPQPQAGEVRVRLATSGVNPSDVKTRGNLRGTGMAFARVIPHSDGAGTIDAVGAGVAASRVGERVWVWNAAWRRAFGTAAQYVTLPNEQAVVLPENVDFAAGACLGIPALTALHAVRMDGGVAGKSVMVTGGAGAVGHYAIQMAKLAGASQVIATVSNEAKAKLAIDAGADLTLNYKDEDVAARVLVATDGDGADRIIDTDFAANVDMDFEAVAPEGDIVVYGSGKPEIAVPFFPAIVKNVRVRFFIVYNLTRDDRQAAIAQLAGWLKRGLLTHNVALRLPLERIAEAHEAVERGAVAGNVVLEVT
jgi:NADPH2:quinone reductase